MKIVLLAGLAFYVFSAGSLADLSAPRFTPGGGLVRSPALVKVTHANPAGVVFYTTDGSDPRDRFGNVAPTARAQPSPISVNCSMLIRARVKNGAEWSEPTAAAFTADQDFSNLLFTEVMFHPRDTDDLAEFVELKNVGSVPLDLSGLELRYALSPVGPTFQFQSGKTIPPGGFIVLAHSAEAFRALYPDVPFDGPLSARMGNSFESLVLQSAEGAIATRMRYDTAAPWQVVADNHGYFPPRRGSLGPDPAFEDAVGFTLVRTTLDPAADSEDHRTWRSSTHRLGSPGADDPPAIVLPVYINELLTRPGAGADAVELYNPNSVEVNIGGWWLSDERNAPFGYPIPAGTVIPPLGYLVLDETQFGGGEYPLSFSAEGERCYLFSADASGVLTGYSHGFVYSGSERNMTFGRFVASDGSESFPPQITATLGAANSGPRTPPIVISEIMYDPAGTEAEYIELRNVTDSPIDLWDPQNPTSTWSFIAGYSYTAFPSNTTLPARGSILLVTNSPEVFRATHGIPSSVLILKLTSALRLNEEFLAVYRPDGVRNILVDEVTYSNRPPWPIGAAGSSHSIERLDLTAFGNNSDNWRLSPTIHSIAQDNAPNLPPQVWAGGNRHEFPGEPRRLIGVIKDDAWPGSVLTSFWSQVSGPATVTFTEPDSGAVTAFFPAAGQYVLRLTASDGVSTREDTTTIQVEARPFTTWRDANFTLSEQADPAISGTSANPDGDGGSNLHEYFFVSHPKTPGFSSPVKIEQSEGRVQLRWSQTLAPHDLIVEVERADQVAGPWFACDDLFEWAEVNAATVKQVIVRERHPIDGRTSGFLRLRLTER
jgi:hypothetical protein